MGLWQDGHKEVVGGGTKMKTLESILERIEQPEAKVKVLAVTTSREPDLAHLRAMGLDIEDIIGNKVIGRIERRLIPYLETDPQIVEVERSVMLNPHRISR